MAQKHTSQLVDQFRHHLLSRREELYDLQDKMSEDTDEQMLILLRGVNEEVERINNIFKLIQKGKI